ncbi:mas-related G-protein coupled receptor member H-like [Spea bombifrons]|uniref:mas-related G-protein coupled receptor member H-like n=1 Tax=Spea bombifrons TaxID=233779 RepID=UPI00234B8CC2|nr:mas-related G-protein coupled receptor member H-like [Spea bombifrons]
MELNNTDPNSTDWYDGGYAENPVINFTIAVSVAIALCLVGMAGNIIVFWHLSFKIKRNKYTVYIINLVAADLIFLTFTAILMALHIYSLNGPDIFSTTSYLNCHRFVEICYKSSQYSGMFFLTAISLERCLSVFFPMWYHFHRPKNQSSITCFLLWITGFAQSLIESFVCPPEELIPQTKNCTGVKLMTFIIAIGVCLPLMVLSSLTLLINIKRTFKDQYPSKLYIIIIVAVIVFILSVMPLHILWLLMYFKLFPLDVYPMGLFYATVYVTGLNSTLNPYIYFVVGKQWKQKSHHSIHDILQRAFADDGEIKGERKISQSNEANISSCQTQNSDMERQS